MKKSWINFILFVVLIAVLAVITDLVLGVVWKNPYRHEKPDYVVTLRYFHAGTDYVINRVAISPELAPTRFQTDERGYILPSKTTDHPDATILFLGGSTTECVAVTDTLRFHAVTAKLLADSGYQVNCLNAGRSGNVTQDFLNILLNHSLLDKPDFAIMMEAANDGGLIHQDPEYSTRMAKLYDRNSIAKNIFQACSRRSAVFGLLRNYVTHGAVERNEKGLSPKQWEIDPEPFRARLLSLVRICRAFGITPILMTQPSTSFVTELTPTWENQDVQAQLNEVIRETAASEKAPLIDLVAEIGRLPDWDKPQNLFYDGLHVTDRGSIEYGRIIAASLKSLLEARGEKMAEPD